MKLIQDGHANRWAHVNEDVPLIELDPLFCSYVADAILAAGWRPIITVARTGPATSRSGRLISDPTEAWIDGYAEGHEEGFKTGYKAGSHA